MDASQFNTNYYYIKHFTPYKVNNTNNLWREVAFIVRKDNFFISWVNTSTNLGFEKTHSTLLSRIRTKTDLINKKPADWEVINIYEIIAEYFHIYDGSIRLDIKNYRFHDDLNIIKRKIRKLSEHQKSLMIYPSNEFCYSVLESEYLFRVKFDLYQIITEIEYPSNEVISAYKKLEKAFVF